MSENEKNVYNELMKVVGWFMFDLLLLGYVEDTRTGLSFCLPKGWNWAIYIEVCCPFFISITSKTSIM